MKKSILIVLLIITSQLKAMDIWNIPNKDEYLDILGVDKIAFEQTDKKPQTEEEKQTEKERQWGMIRKSYLRLAQKAHPDKGGDPAEWAKISNAYEAFKKAYEGPSKPASAPSLQLQEQMKTARMNAANLINQADKIDDPDKARVLYEEAIEPFKKGSAIEENTLDYGIDLVSSVYSKIVQKYYQKAQYEKAVEYGNKYINILIDIGVETWWVERAQKENPEIAHYFEQLNLPGYNAKLAYTKILDENLKDLTNNTKNAFSKIKKIFGPIWIQIKQDLKSNNIEKIKNTLNQVENYLKYEYKDPVRASIFDNFDQRSEYIKGYLQLADAYIKNGKLEEAQKTIQKGLEIGLEFQEDIYRDVPVPVYTFELKNEFENKLNLLNQKIQIEALKQLIHSFSDLKGKLTIS